MAKEDDFFKGYTKSVRKRVTKTTKEMADMLKKEVEKNISLDDSHTKSWLRSQGHPYAMRDHQPSVLGHNEVLVHKQGDKPTSNMHEHVKIFEGRRKDELQVGISEEDVPYVGYILYGTSKMVGRDFLNFSFLNMSKTFRKMIKKMGKKGKK